MELELVIQDTDYLQILEEGNFINFVCMALCQDNKTSVVKTESLRLKVIIVYI